MAKIELDNPRASLYPVPVTLVTCSDGSRVNVITISWTGILSSHPPTVYISVRPERYSYRLIKGSERFCINIPGASMLGAVDYCGSSSGADVDKARACSLDYVELVEGYPPAIAQCAHHLLCEKVDELPLGSHTAFVGVVKHEFVEEGCAVGGTPDYGRIDPLAYCRKGYFVLGRNVGAYGKVGD